MISSKLKFCFGHWVEDQICTHLYHCGLALDCKSTSCTHSVHGKSNGIYFCLLDYNSSSHPLLNNKNTQNVSTKYECASFKNAQSIYFLQNIDHSSWPKVKNCKAQNLVLVPESKGTPISTDICPIPLDMCYCTIAYQNFCSCLGT